MPDEFQNERVELDSPAQKAVAVTPGSSPLAFTTRAIFIGGAGDINVTMAGGGNVLFKGNAAGAILPLRVTHILSSTTTATDIVAIW